MGGIDTPNKAMDVLTHFFQHLGVPKLSPKMMSALLDAVQQDMRASGALKPGERFWISVQKTAAGKERKQKRGK